MNTPLPQHVIEIDSGKPGPRVGIQAITHGDEPAGMSALEYLKEYFVEHELPQGSLYLIQGNPAAYEMNRRCIRENMNRVFLKDDELLKKKFDQDSTDVRRAKELMPLLASLDYHLDIHSTSKPSEPFIISITEDEAHFQLARTLPGVFASRGWGKAISGSVSEWVDKHGGIGITIECGCHQDESAKTVAIQAAEQFLQTLGMADFGRDIIPLKKCLHIVEHRFIGDAASFRYTKDYRNFDPLQPGELIARDDRGVYQAPDEEGLLLVFPASEESIKNGGNDDAYMIGKLEDF